MSHEELLPNSYYKINNKNSYHVLETYSEPGPVTSIFYELHIHYYYLNFTDDGTKAYVKKPALAFSSNWENQNHFYCPSTMDQTLGTQDTTTFHQTHFPASSFKIKFSL